MRTRATPRPCTLHDTSPERRDRGRGLLALAETRATITVEEAAALLGIGRTAAYEAARRGQLPTRRLGRRLLVPVPALLEWLGAPTPTASPPEPLLAEETR